MGFLDMFVKQVPDDEPQQTTNNNVPQTAPSVVPTMQQPAVNPTPVNVNPTPVQPTTVQVDMNCVKQLYQDLIDGEIKGSYLELKQNAEALSSMGLPEAQRFVAALKIMQAKDSSLTKESMINSIDEYIKKLGAIQTEAMSECDAKYKSIQSQKAQTISATELLIKEKQDEINKLQLQIAEISQSIAEHQVDVDRVKNEEAMELNELLKNKAVFEESFKYVQTSLNNDRNIISGIN